MKKLTFYSSDGEFAKAPHAFTKMMERLLDRFYHGDRHHRRMGHFSVIVGITKGRAGKARVIATRQYETDGLENTIRSGPYAQESARDRLHQIREVRHALLVDREHPLRA